MMRRTVLWAAGSLTLVVVCGCGSLLTSDTPAETVYLLDAPAIATELDTGNQTLSISVAVSAAPGLDEDRILRRGPGATLRPYAAARWADNIPDVLETVVRTTLEDSGRFSVVAAASSGRQTDWRLVLEVRAFYAVVKDDASAPVIEVDARGYLTCPGAVVPVRLRAQSAASANTLTGITAAFRDATEVSLTSLPGQLPAGC